LADGDVRETDPVVAFGAGWRFSVLGRLEVVADGRPVQVRSTLAGRLLASLLLRAGEVVASHQLVEAVWEVAPRNAANSLHVLVRRLRAVLGSASWIEATRKGYAIHVGAAELDVAEFRKGLREADVAARAADRTAERSALTSALVWWPSTDTVPDLGFLSEPDATDLTEEWLTATTRRIELDLVDGAYDAAIPVLRRLTRSFPLRDGLWLLLLTALRDAGRHAEALAAYGQLRHEVADLLGVEPGPALREMHAQLLAEDHPGSEWNDASNWQAPSELPSDAAHLVGRDVVAEQLVQALRPGGTARIAVIWGQPGVGKSALGVRVGHRLREHFPDGQWYVPLTTTDDSPTAPAEILEWLLVASGMAEGLVPRSLAARSAALRSRLADRRVLLVLDGVTSSRQVLPLLPGTPGSAVLVTSVGAQPDLPDALHLRLAPLTSTDGWALLTGVLGEKRVAAQRIAAMDVVRLCSGLPMALRIAAARLVARPDLDLTWLAARLRDEQTRLDELSVGELQLRSSLHLAFDALDPTAQRAIRYASWFPRSGFAAWAIGACTDSSDGERAVETLVAAGLLDTIGIDAAGQRRYRCHDMVALYARERSRELEPDDAKNAIGGLLDTAMAAGECVYEQLSGWSEDLAPQEASTSPAWRPPAECDVKDWLLIERDVLTYTIQAGCSVGLYERAARLADLVLPALACFGDLDRLRTCREVIRDAAFAAGDDLIGWRAEFGRIDAMMATNLYETEELAGKCLAAFEKLSATEERVLSLATLAYTRAKMGKPDSLVSRQARDLASTTGNPAMVQIAGRGELYTLIASDRADEALAIGQELIDAAANDNDNSLGTVLADGAFAAFAADRVDLAITFTQRADQITIDAGVGVGSLLLQWSRIHAANGNGPEAVASAKEAMDLMVRIGNRRMAATAQFRLGQAYAINGDHTDASAVLHQAQLALREVGEADAAKAAGQLLTELENHSIVLPAYP
jgi:DNA-binding SARP family transcriptional activator